MSAIFVSASHNNQVYNNTIFNTDDGISLTNGASKNKIHDNRIINSINALIFNAGSHNNILYSNNIVNATQHMIKYDDQYTKDNNNNSRCSHEQRGWLKAMRNQFHNTGIKYWYPLITSRGI
jgi:parallel beta-helix repeat protein